MSIKCFLRFLLFSHISSYFLNEYYSINVYESLDFKETASSLIKTGLINQIECATQLLCLSSKSKNCRHPREMLRNLEINQKIIYKGISIVPKQTTSFEKALLFARDLFPVQGESLQLGN